MTPIPTSAKDKQETKNMLCTITAKAVQETFDQFGFVLPSMYQSVFSREAKEKGIVISDINENIELLELIEEHDRAKKENREYFKALLNHTLKARHAIATKNQNALREVEEATKFLLNNLEEKEEVIIKDSVTGFLTKEGVVKYCVTPDDGNFIFDGALFVLKISNFEELKSILSVDGYQKLLQLFANNVIKESVKNIPNEDIYLSRVEEDTFAVICKINQAVYYSGVIKKLQKTPPRIQINTEKIETLNFSFGKVGFKRQDMCFREVMLKALKQVNIQIIG